MSVFQLMIEAIESLNMNKVRSGLTMLGIIIGVAAVIAMMSIGAGAQNSITSQINSIGTNLLYVMSFGRNVTNPKPLTMGDAAAIANPKLAPAVSMVAPVINQSVTVTAPGDSETTNLIGLTPAYFQVQKADLAEGQIITDFHLDNRESVVLLGSETAQNLFGSSTGVVGKTVRIQGQVFTVIGVLKSQGGSGFGSNDDRILAPLTTVQQRLTRRGRSDQIDQIFVQAKDSQSVDQAVALVTQILTARHKIADNNPDFRILSTQSLLDTASTVTGVLTVFLGGIAGVSLLVGGIGIMNIMLVSVSERTREIGLRKAIGARKWDIRMQFLVESLLLSLGGGAIGVLTGWGIAMLVGKIAAVAGYTLTPAVQLNSVLLATIFSAAIGIFFGLYPANRAASLEPVEALRTE
jgi:putative ABC transport system permease protein